MLIKKHLLAPGPTPVPPEVLMSMAMPIIHHRAPDFLPIMEGARNGLKWLCQTKSEVLMLTCSGTGAMTAAINNFFNSGDKVLVVNAGKFGERWTKIAKAHGLSVKELAVTWGYTVKPDDVAKELKADPDIKGVLIQASETSTGVYHDVKSVAAVVKQHAPNALFVVDAISAMVAHDIRPDEWGIDILVSGAQKGFMIPPGLAFISASEKAWEKEKSCKTPRFYFNLKKELESHKKNQTNFTPAISLIIGLNEALKILQAEGLENVFKRHETLATAMRAAMGAMGLGLFAKESPSNALTAIEAPAGIDGQEIYKNLRQHYGITGAGGQDAAKGKIFRIAHLGYADTFDVIVAVSGIEMVLKKLGYKLTLGAGVAAAEEILMVK